MTYVCVSISLVNWINWFILTWNGKYLSIYRVISASQNNRNESKIFNNAKIKKKKMPEIEGTFLMTNYNCSILRWTKLKAERNSFWNGFSFLISINGISDNIVLCLQISNIISPFVRVSWVELFIINKSNYIVLSSTENKSENYFFCRMIDFSDRISIMNVTI